MYTLELSFYVDTCKNENVHRVTVKQGSFSFTQTMKSYQESKNLKGISIAKESIVQ